MMRYERVSPEECVALSNGKKPNLKTTCSKQQQDGGSVENGRIPNYNNNNNNNNTSCSSFEAKGSSRFRSPSKTQDHNSSHIGNGAYIPTSSPQLDNNNINNHDTTRSLNNSPSPNHGSGDVLLQWGQKKRSRASRAVTDDSSSSSSAPSAQARQQQQQQAPKIQRRRLSLTQSSSSPSLPVEKLSTTAQTGSMPPPPPPPPAAAAAAASNGRRRSSITTKESSSSGAFRNVGERSGTENGIGRVVSRSTTSTVVVGKRPSPSPEKVDGKKIPGSGWPAKDEKPNESRIDSTQEAGAVANNNNSILTAAIAIGGGEKGIVQAVELPRIYLSLSRKEKEDDFLAMKGTKLPHRPKKRPKNVDRSLQYCFPGMWLSDLTRSRYEVREKKSVKKQKRRGLKGMESMDSDSE